MPVWLAPEPTIDATGRREYFRVLSLPRVRRRLNATGDTTVLNEYAKAFENFASYRNQLRTLRRVKDKTFKKSTDSVERFLAHYRNRCQRLAAELGFFFRAERQNKK